MSTADCIRPVTAEDSKPHKLRVLLLDDEPGILIPTAGYFRRLGCAVDAAEEAEEALALIAHRRYDLAIMDLQLTRVRGAEGLEVLRALRVRNHWTSVIVLSAFISEEAETELRLQGADAILRKPQNLPELAQIAFNLTGIAQ